MKPTFNEKIPTDSKPSPITATLFSFRYQKTEILTPNEAKRGPSHLFRNGIERRDCN